MDRTFSSVKLRGYFKAGAGGVKEGGEAGAVGGLQSFAGRNALYCAVCWHSFFARLLREMNFSQNLIVFFCELVSLPSHLIPTFAYGECHFNAAFLDFITSGLSTASETAFQSSGDLFCRAGRKTSLPFFP